tara:strand:+ start:1154 stop:1591 length:438 start_codon:yes stop_codon:yes gene_type:complete
MVDSILTNQAPIVQKPAENRSITSAAVSNASSVPEVDLAEDTIELTPRTMDSDPNQQFSSVAQQGSGSIMGDIIDSGSELRPPLENFGPIVLTSEKALENRTADIEIRSNNEIDETDSIASINNQNIKAFETVDSSLQQSVDLTA